MKRGKEGRATEDEGPQNWQNSLSSFQQGSQFRMWPQGDEGDEKEGEKKKRPCKISQSNGWGPR